MHHHHWKPSSNGYVLVRTRACFGAHRSELWCAPKVKTVRTNPVNAHRRAATADAGTPTSNTLFDLDVSPDLNTTRDFGRPNSSANVSTSSLFALPSTGADLMRTFTASPMTPSSPAREERGCALTLRTVPSAVSVKQLISPPKVPIPRRSDRAILLARGRLPASVPPLRRVSATRLPDALRSTYSGSGACALRAGGTQGS